MRVFDFYDETALLDRLTHGVFRSNQQIVFLLGSAVSAPIQAGRSGVPGVEGVIDLIREEFDSGPLVATFENALNLPGTNRYQSAFRFLIGHRGQQAANEVIRRAVWKARKQASANNQYIPSQNTSDDVCRSCDNDIEGWALPPGVRAAGSLIAKYPSRFGRVALTTNFDPLLEVSIAHAGGVHFRTVLHGDGNIGQTEGNGCHVIHLHGYWHGADTLHTPRQLAQPRPLLKNSLSSLIRGRTVLVCGYGGWDDAFMSALAEVALDEAAYPEIIWALRDPTGSINEEIAERLSPAADRGRVNFYRGIDCHAFMPKLLDEWGRLETPAPPIIVPSPRILSLISVPGPPSENTPEEAEDSTFLEGADQDRPPLVEFCVGREKELAELFVSPAKARFITGLGGQGKSTLAARYFLEAKRLKTFDLFVWRDCKEERERLEIQLVSIIEKLTKGRVRAKDISAQPIQVLAELLVKHAGDRRILLVFDNVDHYVDLEGNKLSPRPQEFLETFLRLSSNCQIVFTCRPTISYPDQLILSQRLGGLSLTATQQLFANRSAIVSSDDLRDAHVFTAGHAFWLDLLAAQIAQKPQLRLPNLLSRADKDIGDIPLTTLQSIWNALSEREQIVLQALAESVRPETEARLGEYLARKLRYNKLVKALRSLRSLNLIVVKPHPDSDDLIELHPLLRQFIKRNFPKQERLAFLDLIIEFYSQLQGIHKNELKRRPRFDVLQHWTETAELDVEAGRFSDALKCLDEVTLAFEGSGFSGEFARVCGLLFERVDWTSHSTFKHFDSVFRVYAHILLDLSRFDEADALLNRFAITVPTKDSRYILYCDTQCYAFWSRGDFSKAMEWGLQGVELEKRSSVDTNYSARHSLALAQRDSGNIDDALNTFLYGQSLATVIDPEELEENRGGHYYGNIGRCLHLMGQIDPAIICYRKSAILIEKNARQEHVINQGFIRRWIGELLLVRDEPCAAKYFLEAASDKWEQVSPHRAEDVQQILEQNKTQFVQCSSLTARDRERYCVAWIYGRDTDFVQ